MKTLIKIGRAIKKLIVGEFITTAEAHRRGLIVIGSNF